MRFASAFAFVMAAMTATASVVPSRPAGAQTLDKISFGTNWVAEAEHGGFYQALADGTYSKYGLDVAIVPGGPQVNNRILLPVGKLDFFMSANTLQSFDAVEQNVPTVVVAASFQKDPQVLVARPDVKDFEDLKNLTLFVSNEGVATYFQWLKSEYKFSEARVKPYTFNPQPFLADRASAMQGYVTSRALRDRKTGGLQAEGLPARGLRLQHLLDADRDAPRPGREEARPGAALRRCLHHRLVQLSLRRQRRRQRAHQEAQSGHD